MNIYQRSHFFITSCLMLTSAVCSAASITKINCPAKIETRQSLIATPKEFTSRSADANHYLDHITFYSGKPEDNASLAPDHQKREKTYWTFSENDSIYISCSYYQTAMELVKPLPKNTRSCVVIYDLMSKGGSGPIPKKISCEIG